MDVQFWNSRRETVGGDFSRLHVSKRRCACSSRLRKSSRVTIVALLLQFVCLLSFTEQVCAQSANNGYAVKADPATALKNQQGADAKKIAVDANVQIDALNLLAVGPNEGRAVLLSKDKKMLTVRVGDSIPQSNAILKEVLSDKIVLEETTSAAEGKQLVWMWKGTTNAPGKIQRFASNSPQAFSLHAPGKAMVSIPAPPTSQGATSASAIK